MLSFCCTALIDELALATVNAPKTVRERVRAEMIGEIKAVARAQLASHGAAALSLRAISRELGMVSSAIYRYFPSRDDLLTALIVDSYGALGAAAERTDAAAPDQDDFTARWLAAGRTIRGWAVEHPHEYALLYGSPVPGYRAPQDTIPAATRVIAVLARVVRDAAAAGALAGPADAVPLPELLAADAARLRENLMPGVDDEHVTRCLLAWLALFGAVSFELFGHLNNVVSDYQLGFEHQLRRLADFVGLYVSTPAVAG